MDGFTSLTVTTLDRGVDIVVQKFPTYFRFTVKPHGSMGTISNMRNYAFSDEVILALKKAGYDYAEELVSDAMERLSVDL